jgi:hypothetical protein
MQKRQQARTAFTAALAAAGGDGPARLLLKRIDAFESMPPSASGDGSWQMEHK